MPLTTNEAATTAHRSAKGPDKPSAHQVATNHRRAGTAVAVVLALLASLVALTATGPSAVAQNGAQQGADLVTTNASNPAGWLLRIEDSTQTKQWLPPSCRQQLEAGGQSFDPVGWSAFGSLPPTASPLSCTEIQSLLGDSEPEANAAQAVTTNANYPHGWILVTTDGLTSKQWLPSSCRSQLEAAGVVFGFQSYNEFGAAPLLSPKLTCTEALDALSQGEPQPTGHFSTNNGQIIDPEGNPFEMVGMNTFGGAFLWSTWDSGIIRDKDIYLNEWGINTIRLNITCDEHCDNSLGELTEEIGSNVQWVDANGPEAWALFDVDGTRWKYYIDPQCKDDLERLSGISFVSVNWNQVVQPLDLWPEQTSITCSGNLPIQDVIDAYAGTGTVIIIESHTLYFPNAPTPAQVQEKVTFFAEMAERYKDDPYVWFSLWNEPLNECNLVRHGAGLVDDDGNPQTVRGQASRTWVDIHVPLIETIRNAGAKNPIVAGTSNYGQDRCDASGDFDYRESAILTYGDDLLAADPEDNIIFDMHYYSRWSKSSIDDANTYFNALHAAGYTTIIGELGGGCSRAFERADMLAMKILLENYEQLDHPPAGLVAWSAATGFVLTDAFWGDASRVTENNIPFDASIHLDNLTVPGKLFYDWAHPETDLFGPLDVCTGPL